MKCYIVLLALCASSVITPIYANKEAWGWVYRSWKSSLKGILVHRSSFTHISPTFYTVNYNYVSGVPQYYSTINNNFGGMTTQKFTKKLSAVGIAVVPAIFGGSGNSGIDVGVKNILDNKHHARTNFIKYMVREANKNGYAGYNIDWEVNIGNTPIKGAMYAIKFANFLRQFKRALGRRSLSVDALDSNIGGIYCSGNKGFINIPLIINIVDRIMINDYSNYLGTKPGSCAGSVLSTTNPAQCSAIYDNDKRSFTKFLNVMRCSNIPLGKIVVGMQADHINNNPIANACMARIKFYGFNKVALWPQVDGNYAYLSANAMRGDWYGILSRFLSKP